MMQLKTDKARDLLLRRLRRKPPLRRSLWTPRTLLDKAEAQLDAATNAETQAENPIENVIQMVSDLATMTMKRLSSTQ